MKYLSALRVKGTPVPANILIVDLNAAQAYLYKSVNYLEAIEKIYNGGASKNNSGFIRLYFCIVSTVEYCEYKVLQELIGSKVKAIIPPTETNIDACIMVGYWGNRIVDNEEITLQGFDILPDDTFSDELILPVKKSMNFLVQSIMRNPILGSQLLMVF